MGPSPGESSITAPVTAVVASICRALGASPELNTDHSSPEFLLRWQTIAARAQLQFYPILLEEDEAGRHEGCEGVGPEYEPSLLSLLS